MKNFCEIRSTPVYHLPLPHDKKGGIFVVLIFLSDFPNILFWYKGVNDRTRGNKSLHAIIIVY